MCQLFSAIVLKNGEVIPCEYIDSEKQFSHTEQLIKLKIKDETSDAEHLEFARIVINPPDGDTFNTDYDKWIFKIDQTITPKWWTKIDEKNCYKALKANIGNYVFIGKNIDLLKNCSIYAAKDCKIEKMEAAQIAILAGSSSVNMMWGSSSVKEMRGSSSVNVMGGSSSVKEMRESSSVNVYSPDAKYKLQDNGLAIIRYKDNIEIVHAKGNKIKLIKQK